MNARSTLYSLLAIGIITFVAGCDEYTLDTEWRSGNYRLIAIDARGQMCLIDMRGGSDDLVRPTVFSIGTDERYIVVAQHPATNAFGDFDRSITHYFIVQRTTGTSPTDSKKDVRGPMSREEFEILSTNLSLPKFSKTFNDLK